MKRTLTIFGLILAFTLSMASYAAPSVKVETSLGEFVVELNQEKAPKTVANFLSYVNSGFYENTIFHRVIDGFMIQGGGFTSDYKRKMPQAPVMNEADNGLRNKRGSIAMARTSDPHSATTQFFINVNNNSNLDHTSKTPRGWGYAVFGHVIKGMGTVDKIRKVKTGPGGPFRSDAPREPVIIKKITLINAP